MLEDIKSIANILFFIVAGTIGVLTYLHARKTVFAPLRTETFKLQLKAFEELLLFFQHKTESEFTEDFDFRRIVGLNAMQMRDAYASAFFPDKLTLDEEEQRKAYEPLRFGLIHDENLEALTEDSHRKPLPTPDPPPDSPALILAQWKTYKHFVIGYTEEFHKRTKDLQRFSASPLLPQKLRDLLGKFQRACEENLALVGKITTDAAQRMPEIFSTTEEVMNFRPDWIWNLYNNESVNLEPIAKEILAFINEYLNIDGLVLPKS